MIKDLIYGFNIDKGVKAGIWAGIVNGIIFLLFIYVILGIKELPIGLLSFGYLIFDIIAFAFEGAILGLIYAVLDNFVSLKKSLGKAIILSMLLWFLVKFIPFRLIMMARPMILVETILRYLLMGILISKFWDYFIPLSRYEKKYE